MSLKEALLHIYDLKYCEGLYVLYYIKLVKLNSIRDILFYQVLLWYHVIRRDL